jgi:hypothetical protein
MGKIGTDYADRPVLDGTEIVHIVFDGVDYQCTVENLLDLVSPGSSGYTPQTVEDITTTTYTITDADMGKCKRITNASGCTVTIPSDDTEPGYDEGAHTDFQVAVGAGQLVIVGEGTAGTGYYVNFPGGTGNFLTTPDHASVETSGSNFEVVWKEMRTDRTPAVAQIVFAKWNIATSRAHYAQWNTDGTFAWNFSGDGTNTTGVPQSGGNATGAPQSAGNATLGDGVIYWFRFRYTHSTRSWVLEYHADQDTEPLSWSAFSASGTTPGNSAVIASTTAVWSVGAMQEGNFQVSTGRVYEMHFRQSHGGANSWSLNPDNWTSGATYTTDTGQVNTLVGTTSITGTPGGTLVDVIPPDGFLAESVGEGDRLAIQKMGADDWSVFGRLAEA